jgi:predicted transcriptional regulator
MTSRPRFARQTSVAECQTLLEIGPLLVPLGADLRDVVRLVARQSATRVIGVVDEAGRLAGVIPVTRVADSIIARVVPEALLVDVADAETATQFSHSMEDRVAADIMLAPATTVLSDTIGDAFRVMHHRHLAGLYIVDADGRPTGYLDLLELALVYVEALGDRASIDGHHAEGTGSDRTS